MNARWVVVSNGTRQGPRWHVRFQAANGEIVVHGEGLESRDAAHRAILSVARAHSHMGEAWLEQGGLVNPPGNPDRVVVAGEHLTRTSIPIVHLSELPKRNRWSRRA